MSRQTKRPKRRSSPESSSLACSAILSLLAAKCLGGCGLIQQTRSPRKGAHLVERAFGHRRRAHRRGEHRLAVGQIPGLPTRGNRWRLSHVSPRHSMNESAAFGRAKTFRPYQRVARLPPANQESEATIVARKFSAGMLNPYEPLGGQMPWWVWLDLTNPLAAKRRTLGRACFRPSASCPSARRASFGGRPGPGSTHAQQSGDAVTRLAALGNVRVCRMRTDKTFHLNRHQRLLHLSPAHRASEATPAGSSAIASQACSARSIRAASASWHSLR